MSRDPRFRRGEPRRERFLWWNGFGYGFAAASFLGVVWAELGIRFLLGVLFVLAVLLYFVALEARARKRGRL